MMVAMPPDANVSGQLDNSSTSKGFHLKASDDFEVGASGGGFNLTAGDANVSGQLDNSSTSKGFHLKAGDDFEVGASGGKSGGGFNPQKKAKY
ncbi:unnamed protein product [Didymodactylos carnosus]|uniref:Uncharacterized protein n=1 Tax=Didymodactylos carnosus TaxID=1234261 RepID=A0A815VCT6_9BILA|nr:unnamed protein product [Didymodactylos carnosus]CAF4388089.1 unnamed protein product [Didymodactylos carnosus]